LLIGNLADTNAALLFVIAGLLNYEYLHLAYHLPNGHWVSRLTIADCFAYAALASGPSRPEHHDCLQFQYYVSDWGLVVSDLALKFFS